MTETWTCTKCGNLYLPSCHGCQQELYTALERLLNSMVSGTIKDQFRAQKEAREALDKCK